MAKEKVLKYGKYALLFLLYFIVQYKFLNASWFATDELDVMTGGKTIASGYLMYGEFYSQHMPFSYYVSAVFDFLGAKSVVEQRLAFYAFYALMWTIINIRYSKVVNKTALAVYPLIFSAVTCIYDMGTVILSEHIAGIGFVILYLEFLNYLETRKLDIWNCIFLSMSIVFTFGAMFVAAFGVFVIAVAVFGKEIQWNVQEGKKAKQIICDMCKKFTPLVVIALIPWVILGLHYLISGVIGEFILQAYTINREVYSKYMGGLGASIADTVLSAVNHFVSTITGCLAVSNLSLTNMIQLILLSLLLVYVIKCVKEGKSFIAIVTVVFLLAMGTRGYFNYHGTHFVEVLSLIASIVLFDVLIGKKQEFLEKKISYQFVVYGMFVIISLPYFKDVVPLANNMKLLYSAPSFESYIVRAITDEDEAVWQLNFANDLVMYSDRPTIRNAAAVPWFWEANGLYTLEEISKDMPRVAFYAEGHEVWGNVQAEYAPELVAFIKRYYINFEDIIYVRRDYYEEATQKWEAAAEEWGIETGGEE